MCLSIPMLVEEVDGLTARCSAKGVERTASLVFMMDAPPVPGEYVMVNLGHAVEKVSAEDARETWRLFDLMLADS